MDFSNCNLCHPKLAVAPSFGDAMVRHGLCPKGSDRIRQYDLDRVMEVSVDWGQVDLSTILSRRRVLVDSLRIELTVHGICRKPAMALMTRQDKRIEIAAVNEIPEMAVKWKHEPKDGVLYPEYLAQLRIRCGGEIIAKRVLHAAPPPLDEDLAFKLDELVWAPGLFVDEPDLLMNIQSNVAVSDQALEQCRRRRGFGIEVETVQLPPDFDEGCFTHQQQFQRLVEKAQIRHPESSTGQDRALWDGLSKWSVSHDLYVENGAPPTRVRLYERINDAAHSMSECSMRTLNNLILGGRVGIPKEWMDRMIPSVNGDEIPASQASPEYKSPAPPHELYHAFPPPKDGNDEACASIRLFLDGVIKNGAVSSRPVLVPTVSDIGQSASSIHVHINVTNEDAWPRTVPDDVEVTEKLLCVIFAWIIYDRVISTHFCKANVVRDRSFAPMFVSGPEFIWREHSWQAGTSVLTADEASKVGNNNMHAWAKHVYSCMEGYRDGKQPKESLFQAVFDLETTTNTISRWCALNLLPLHKYGTIEVRRCHATLDADWVCAWTWFCVGFVEKLISCPTTHDNFFRQIINAETWLEMLSRLEAAQNQATLEDLVELLEGSLPEGTFATLLR